MAFARLSGNALAMINKTLAARSTATAQSRGSPLPQDTSPVATKSKAQRVNLKSPKRDNIFSESRDTREDHGTRQMRTTHGSETLFRMCGNF
jgi:hypothetical protein